MPKFRITRTRIVTEEVVIKARDRMAAGEKARVLSAEVEEGRGLFEHVGAVVSIIRLGDVSGHSLAGECPSCGAAIGDESRTCDHCGRALHPNET